MIGSKNQFPKVSLVDPTSSDYLLFALQIDRRRPIGFFIESQQKNNFVKAKE